MIKIHISRLGTVAVALVAASTSYGQTLSGVAQTTNNTLPSIMASHQATPKAATSLTDSEMKGLLYMREEEKLSLDVYVVLAKKWGSRPFGNISQAEQSHMKSVKVLLDKYGLADPIANLKPGLFKDESLQKLYDDFVKAGNSSRIEALKVGATIEDLDLYDLARWAKLTNKQDILSMYEVLAAGSRNHMRAFLRNLGNSGFTYEPKYISQETFDKIISSATERGARLDLLPVERSTISSLSTCEAVPVPPTVNGVAILGPRGSCSWL
jgi:hypothetical protein